VPAGHATQSSSDAAPRTDEKVPAGHGRHAADASPGGDHSPRRQHTEEPALLARPAVQLRHVAFEIAP
jgi:hypothetical protein